MFLFDVSEERGVAEIRFSTWTFKVPRFDGDEVVVEWILSLHVKQ